MLENSFFNSNILSTLNSGIWMSIKLIIPAAILGLLLGIVIGTMRIFGGKILSRLASSYVAIFRGTPLLIQLFILYYGLPKIGIILDPTTAHLLGAIPEHVYRIVLEPYTAALIGFIFCSAAYHSEYIRGGLASIKRGQLLAAQSLGFSHIQALRTIIIPQAFRKALPGCSNEIVYLIKYSSLAQLVSCMELTGYAKNLASETVNYTGVFLVVGLYYLCAVTIVSFLLHRLEKKISIPGFGTY